MTGTSWKERIEAAARAHAQRQEEEARAPHLAEARRRARAAEAAEEKRAHEAEQLASLPAHLERCGFRAGDAAKLAVGLSDAWGLVGEGGRQTSALRAARAWWASHKLLLFLFGAPGTGKTLAAGELLTRCRLDYHHPDWGLTWCWPTTASEMGLYALAGDLATRSTFGEETDKLRERLARCRLLVLDELGTEVMTGPWLSMCETLVVRRHASGLRTVLLSNVSGADFRTRYGERIARRVREDGYALSLGTATLSSRQEVRNA